MSGRCIDCAHFRNDPAELEAAFPGLNSLSSANNASRADDGLCLKHDRYIGAGASCSDYTGNSRTAENARRRGCPARGRTRR
jgi:hypothetical protein